MSSYTTVDIRNIALVGHAGAGKTLLADMLLHRAGAVAAPGAINKGSTASDHDPLEHRHQHSLAASVMGFEYGDCHINLVDTPGYPDFIGTTLSVLPAVETVVVTINAQAGIESSTRRFMEWATQRRFCRMIVVNKIDAEDIDLAALYQDVRDTFGAECLAINLPADGGTKVADCFFEPAGTADFYSVEAAHTAIVDQTVEVDEDLMALYLEQGQVSPEQLHDPFDEALREGHLVPVCFTSATTGVGVGKLLDIFARLMPNPAEGNPPEFVDGLGDDAEAITVAPDPDQHILAHVFKIAFDPFVGKVGVFRIHQGTLRKDSQLFIGDARKSIKLSNLYVMHGKEHLDVDGGVPGDIRALAKVDALAYDTVLHDSHEQDQIRLRGLDLPVPMVGLAVFVSSRGDEQKLSEALRKLTQEDPCLRVERSAVANETVLRGLGELHLRIAIERLQTQYHVDVRTATPAIPYRETVAKAAEGHCRHKKQTGGAGQFGEVFLKIEPLARGAGVEFENKIVGGAIPAQFVLAVEKGVRQAVGSGVFAGFPMQDIRVTVHDGKYHPVDSKEVAFVAAGRKAFIDAVSKARPIVLEPIFDIDIAAPAAHMGDVTGDLSARRGRVNSTDALADGLIRIVGQVPLAELDGYPSKLKSVTGGEGSYRIDLSGYEPAPADVQKRLSEAFKHPGGE